MPQEVSSHCSVYTLQRQCKCQYAMHKLCRALPFQLHDTACDYICANSTQAGMQNILKKSESQHELLGLMCKGHTC